jgi:competence protein ComEC
VALSHWIGWLASLGLPLSQDAGLSQEPGFFMRVLDTGQGLCCILRFPTDSGPKFVVYDAGRNERLALEGIRQIAPLGSEIEWMVLSHTDADHIAAADELLGAYTIRKIVWPENPRTTKAWREADAAIGLAALGGRSVRYRAEDPECSPGKSYPLGVGRIVFVCGFDRPLPEWGFAPSSSEYQNAGSVVIRAIYKGKQVLLTGDAVGRKIGGPPEECLATEKLMVDRSGTISIRADVLVAAHHGGDNGSSLRFLQKVKPRFVVFSAGRGHEHPRADTVTRILGAGILPQNCFRTDREDDEGHLEWNLGRLAGHKDPSGDDDVDVNISPQGVVRVQYRG